MSEKITVRGVSYVSHSALSFGDYGGAGSVGLANVRTLMAEHDSVEVYMSNLDNHYFHDEDWALKIEQDRPALLVAFGSYGGQQAWLREDLADDTLRALSDYPCLDDQEVSKVEAEWLEEALDSYLLRFDIPRALRDIDEELEDKWNDLSAEAQRRLFYDAMEDAGIYPEPEYSSVYIDAEKIARHIRFDHVDA